ncbi:MAG: hypothetical protein RLZZ403_1574, partial [Pseudomonadota bacterium]
AWENLVNLDAATKAALIVERSTEIYEQCRDLPPLAVVPALSAEVGQLFVVLKGQPSLSARDTALLLAVSFQARDVARRARILVRLAATQAGT